MPHRIQPHVKVMTALLTPAPDKQAELHQTLEVLGADIRRAPGCLQCVVGQEVPRGPHYMLLSVWEDARALDAHMASDTFRILLGANNVLTAPAHFQFVVSEPIAPAWVDGTHRP